ncbi:MAG TPA: response regulator transcription factor [Daejeonella sp.]|nr:response regulator transcription factor [Daejeonella sp.]
MLINVLLAEDHNIVRNGIKSLLDNEANIHVMGEASNGQEVLRILKERPDIELVLADLNMPMMGGIELIQQLSKHFSHVHVVVLSMSDHENYVTEAFNAGARGYLLKNISKDELVFAIKHVASGANYICNELAIRIFRKNMSHESLDIEMPHLDFTKREMDVLKLIAEGYTNSEIADKLFTSRRTVEGHRKNMVEKAGVANTAALIMQAFRGGIIK